MSRSTASTDIFQAIADPTRRAILDRLQRGEQPVIPNPIDISYLFRLTRGLGDWGIRGEINFQYRFTLSNLYRADLVSSTLLNPSRCLYLPFSKDGLHRSSEFLNYQTNWHYWLQQKLPEY